MRMQQVELRVIAQVAALLLTGLFLIAAIGRLPLFLTDRRTLLYALTGLSPLAFLRGEALARYFGPAVTLGGFTGLLIVFGKWLECILGNEACAARGARSLTALGFYTLAAMSGLLIMRRIRKIPRDSDVGS